MFDPEKSQNPFARLGLEPVDIGEFIYPTPRRRKEVIVEGEFDVGDVVSINVGNAAGKLGVVVVDRNDNYIDKTSVPGPAIGVQVLAEPVLDRGLADILRATGVLPSGVQLISETRWFEPGQGQLDFVFRAPQD